MLSITLNAQLHHNTINSSMLKNSRQCHILAAATSIEHHSGHHKLTLPEQTMACIWCHTQMSAE